MLKRVLLSGAAVLAFAFAPAAYADTITYTATLLGSNEVPPTGSSGRICDLHPHRQHIHH